MHKTDRFSSDDSNSLLRILSTPVFRFGCNDPTSIIDFNQAFLAMFGFKDRSEIEGLSEIDLYLKPLERDLMWQELRAKGLVIDREMSFMRKDKRVFLGRMTSTLIRDDDGNELYADGVIDDISDQKVQLHSVTEPNAKNHSISEATSEVIIFSKAGLILEVSLSAIELFQYSESEFAGKQLSKILENIDQYSSSSASGSQSQQPRRILAIKRDGSHFPVQIMQSSFLRDNQIINVTTLTDLSIDEQSNDRLKVQQQELLLERKVFFNGPVVVLEWPLSAEEPLLNITENVKELLGYEAAEFIDGSVLYPDLVHENDKFELQEYVRSVVNGNSEMMLVHPYRLRKKNGEYVWVQDYAYVQRDSQGKAFGILGYIYDVSDLQNSQRETAESEQRYRSLVENSPTGILRIDTQGNILEVNQKMVEMLGSPSKEATQKFNLFTFQPLIEAGISQQFTDVFREDKITTYSGEYTTHWGKVLYFQLVITPIHDSEGGLLGAQANMEDISEVREVESAKREIEKAHLEERNIFMAGPIMIIKWPEAAADPILSISDNIKDILGYTVDEVLKGDVRPADLIHSDDIERVKDIGQKAIDAGLTAFDTTPYRMKKKDGSYIWVSDYSTVNRDQSGEIKYYSGLVWDVSKTVEAQQELRLTEQTYQELFNSISEAIFIHDAKTYEILDVNKTMLDMYGFESHEVIGSNIQDYSYRSDVMTDVNSLFEKTKNEGQHTFEWEAKHKDGHKFWVEVTLRTAKIRGENRLLANVRDISNRKQIMSDLKLSIQEQELLLREVHHRVKNNMQVIISLLNIQAEYTKDDKLSEIFKETQNRIRTMALIHEKLFRSKSMASVDFSNYINSLVWELKNFYSGSARRVQIQQEISALSLDITKAIPCGLIVNELVTNAMKYAFPDNREGVIWITARTISGHKAEIAIVDNGIGLGSEINFEETQSMGLRIVRILTEQLGGTINISREQGTGFSLIFNLIDA